MGHKIIERNYRKSYGEIDIISVSDSVLVFSECKFRRSLDYGNPLEAVNLQKQKKICLVALFYMKTHNIKESTPCRFDVIGISPVNSIEHIENAFEFVY